MNSSAIYQDTEIVIFFRFNFFQSATQGLELCIVAGVEIESDALIAVLNTPAKGNNPVGFGQSLGDFVTDSATCAGNQCKHFENP